MVIWPCGPFAASLSLRQLYWYYSPIADGCVWLLLKWTNNGTGGEAAILRAPNQLCYFVCFFALFVTHFVHVADTISYTISYDQKELLDIRTAITHLKLDKDVLFNDSDTKNILLCQGKAQIHVISVKKRWRNRGRMAWCLVRIHRWVGKPPLPCVLLANMQSLENKLDDLQLRLSYKRNIKNCNILCFTETCLNDKTDNIELAGFSMHWQYRIEVEYLMISCRPHYLPRVLICIIRSRLFTTTNRCWL